MGHVIHELIKLGCMFLSITLKSNTQNPMFDIFSQCLQHFEKNFQIQKFLLTPRIRSALQILRIGRKFENILYY